MELTESIYERLSIGSFVIIRLAPRTEQHGHDARSPLFLNNHGNTQFFKLGENTVEVVLFILSFVSDNGQHGHYGSIVNVPLSIDREGQNVNGSTSFLHICDTPPIPIKATEHLFGNENVTTVLCKVVSNDDRDVERIHRVQRSEYRDSRIGRIFNNFNGLDALIITAQAKIQEALIAHTDDQAFLTAEESIQKCSDRFAEIRDLIVHFVAYQNDNAEGDIPAAFRYAYALEVRSLSTIEGLNRNLDPLRQQRAARLSPE